MCFFLFLGKNKLSDDQSAPWLFGNLRHVRYSLRICVDYLFFLLIYEGFSCRTYNSNNKTAISR